MATIKLYDIDAYETSFEAVVLSCTEKERVDAETSQKEKVYEVLLDRTQFFPEEGGQTPDQGTLGHATVLDVQIDSSNTITHVLDKPLVPGNTVTGQVDWQHRFYNMQQHGGEHIFSGLTYKKYGYQNVGFHLSDHVVTMDFDGPLTAQQVQELEWEVNEAIAKNVEIKTSYPTNEELSKLPYRSKKALEGPIRIVEISGYDICACCAPHVHRTGELGIFKVQNVQSYKGGVRIRFLCGFRALEDYRQKSQIIYDLSVMLSTNQELLPSFVNKAKAQIQSLKAQLSNAKHQLMEQKIAAIPANQEHVILFETQLDTMVVRSTVNQLVDAHDGICGIFVGDEVSGYTFILGSKTVDCRQIAAKMRDALQARGGGSAAMIQGSVTATPEEIQKVILNIEV